MSTILDLNGTTHTISADTTETYWYITDTSASHDGTLVIEAGAVLQFDDLAGAGFAAAASAITITVNGNSGAKAQIRSVESLPHNPWAMPGAGTTMVATRCQFKGFTGLVAASGWTLNNCEMGAGVYCTPGDVRAATNAPTTGPSAVSTADLERFITDVCAEIDERTGRAWDTRSAVQEIYDWGGSGLLKLQNRPIISISALEFRTGATSFETMTEGVEEDYYMSDEDKELGQVRMLEAPSYVLQAVRVSYSYGESDVPTRIRRLATLLASVPTYRAMQGVGQKQVYADRIKEATDGAEKLMGEFGSNVEVFVSGPARNYGGKRYL